MAVSNKTIIALALLAIAVAVVAESQGTMRPECVVGVRGVQCSAQLSLCVCVVTTQAIHCPACPGLGVTRHAALAHTSGHHSAPHPATPTARLQREYVCHGVWCAGRMCIVQLLTSSRRLRRWLRPTVSWPR